MDNPNLSAEKDVDEMDESIGDTLCEEIRGIDEVGVIYCNTPTHMSCEECTGYFCSDHISSNLCEICYEYFICKSCQDVHHYKVCAECQN